MQCERSERNFVFFSVLGIINIQCIIGPRPLFRWEGAPGAPTSPVSAVPGQKGPIPERPIPERPT